MRRSFSVRLLRLYRLLCRILSKSCRPFRCLQLTLIASTLFVMASIFAFVHFRRPADHARMLPPTFFVQRSIDYPAISLILTVPSFSNALSADNVSSNGLQARAYNLSLLITLLHSLVHADYENDKIHLNLYLAPHRNASSHTQLYTKLQSFHWPHGQLTITNASSGSDFDFVTQAWIPSRTDTTIQLLVDASLQPPLYPNYYVYLKSVIHNYNHTRIAAYALSSVKVRTKATISSSIRVSHKQALFLYQNTPFISALAIKANVWRTFQTWFYAHRSEWFLWPNVVTPKNRRDSAWNNYQGISRAHWTLWFSRFCAEYGLLNMYPTAEQPKPLQPNHRLHDSNELEKFSYDGSHMDYKLTVSADKIARIIELGKRTGGSVSMTLVNSAFVETAKSWVCNVDVAGIRPPGVIWFTTDNVAYEALKDVSDSYAIQVEELRGGRTNAGTSFGTPGYWLLMLERTKLIGTILDNGLSVFLFETDQIWLRDPLPFVHRLMDSGDEVDLVGTLDSRRQISGNFLLLKSSLAMRRTWREVCRKFEGSYKRSGIDGHSARYGRYIDNDQSWLTELVLYDSVFKRKNPTVLRVLDTKLFVDGRWYEGRAKSAIVINNNFVVGIKKKKDRAIKYGHWFLKDGMCNGDMVRAAIGANDRIDGGYGNESRSRMQGGDVEAGLDLAIMAIGKEGRK